MFGSGWAKGRIIWYFLYHKFLENSKLAIWDYLNRKMSVLQCV